MIVAFLSCCTFVGVGIQGRIADRTSDALSAKATLQRLQVDLFSKLKRRIEREVMSAVTEQVAAQNATFAKTVTAYDIARTYLSGAPIYSSKFHDTEKDAGGHPVPDISLSQADAVAASLATNSSVAPVTSLAIPAEGPLQSRTREKVGVPEARGGRFADHGSGTPSEGDLADDAYHLAFDNLIADPVKQFLFHLGNPVLKEFASAILDPVLIEPVERFASEEAARAMRDGFDSATIRAHAVEAVFSLTGRLSSRIITRSTSPIGDEAPLGDPRWDAVRAKLRIAVGNGLHDKGPQVQNEARDAVAHFDQVRQALNTILVDDEERASLGEAAFSTYLDRNPDYAALWGYAVIAFTPEAYKPDLETMATQIGPPNDVLTSLGTLVGARALGLINVGDKAAELLQQIDPDHNLTPFSTSTDYRRAWYQHHGPYPEDGYALYKRESGGVSVDDALVRYRAAQVSRYVEEFCPNT